MEERILDAANNYKDQAEKLKSINEQHILDDSVPEELGVILIRLYFGELLNTELQKCEDLLDEETDEETAEAVAAAADVIYDTLQNIYLEIESYADKDSDFKHTLDEISEDSSNEGLHTLLYKLYRCGSIIRDAYNSSVSIPLYGMVMDNIVKPKSTEPDITTMPEDSIQRRLGIDIYRLLEVKHEILEETQKLMGGTENIDKYINSAEETY